MIIYCHVITNQGLDEVWPVFEKRNASLRGTETGGLSQVPANTRV